MAEKAEDQPAGQSASAGSILEQMEKVVPRASPPQSNEEVAEKQPEQKPEQKRPSKLKQLWQKAGLDYMTLALMLKGSLPPTIAIAMYQSRAVSSQYGTIGYLVAIR